MFDIINGIFESFGSIFICFSIAKVLKDKEVKGISWIHASFFTAWGFWNLFYYPSLDQWFSFFGGVAIVSANFVWVVLLIYFSVKDGSIRDV